MRPAARDARTAGKASSFRARVMKSVVFEAEKPKATFAYWGMEA